MESSARSISVTGHGSALTAPDTAVAHVSVECLEPTVAGAFRGSEDRLTAVVNALHAAGVQPVDVATSGRSLRAERRWKDGNDAGLLGYVAQGGLRVVIRSLPQAASVLQEAMDAGGEQLRLESFSLSVSDPAEAVRRARDAAWTDAVDRARQLAEASGTRLGEVLSVDEGSLPSPLPSPVFARAALAGGGAGVQPGEEEVTVSVAVRWAIA
ncbi:SIMPL domain-containing protein [Arthrobacter sp. NPDC090010]|uniref:SIMPL domain-containing protein n=1 Tax=Arthrobacter sp. NPDC090010 TaxID=3363942 RepID=UPI0037F1AEF1